MANRFPFIRLFGANNEVRIKPPSSIPAGGYDWFPPIRSTTPPTGESGLIWEEIDGTGNLIGEWIWRTYAASGYWISRTLYPTGGVIFNRSGDGTLEAQISTPTRNVAEVWTEGVAIQYRVSGTNNSTTYWSFRAVYINQINDTQLYTGWVNPNTQNYIGGNPPEKIWVPIEQPILACGYRHQVIRTGTPGTVQASISTVNREIRLIV